MFFVFNAILCCFLLFVMLFYLFHVFHVLLARGSGSIPSSNLDPEKQEKLKKTRKEDEVDNSRYPFHMCIYIFIYIYIEAYAIPPTPLEQWGCFWVDQSQVCL